MIAAEGPRLALARPRPPSTNRLHAPSLPLGRRHQTLRLPSWSPWSLRFSSREAARREMLALLLAAAAANSAALPPAPAVGAPCQVKDFSGHHCPIANTNLTSSKVATPAACAAAVCAASTASTKLDYAGWCAAGAGCKPVGCYGATISKQHNCLRAHGWVTSTVNYVPAPPGPPKPPPPPPGPAPPPAPIPFGFAKSLGNGMVLAAAPKQAMVWGFCAPGASVEVSIDGVGKLQATVGPDQATGALTTWRVKLVRFCIYNDEFCIKNDELCIKNDEVCIKHDELCSRRAKPASPTTRSPPRLPARPSP